MEIPRGLVFSADAEPLRDVVAAHRDTCTKVGHTHTHTYTNADRMKISVKTESGRCRKLSHLGWKYQQLAVGYGFDLLWVTRAASELANTQTDSQPLQSLLTNWTTFCVTLCRCVRDTNIDVLNKNWMMPPHDCCYTMTEWLSSVMSNVM